MKRRGLGKRRASEHHCCAQEGSRASEERGFWSEKCRLQRGPEEEGEQGGKCRNGECQRRRRKGDRRIGRDSPCGSNLHRLMRYGGVLEHASRGGSLFQFCAVLRLQRNHGKAIDFFYATHHGEYCFYRAGV